MMLDLRNAMKDRTFSRFIDEELSDSRIFVRNAMRDKSSLERVSPEVRKVLRKASSVGK